MASSKELTALEKVYVQHEGRIFVDHFRCLTSKCIFFFYLGGLQMQHEKKSNSFKYQEFKLFLFDSEREINNQH